MASEKRKTKSALTFSSVPHDEAEYKGWRHEAYRAVRAKYLDRLPQEKTKDVDKYLNAFLHGEVIPITSELESNDAAVGVALSQSLEKHPSLYLSFYNLKASQYQLNQLLFMHSHPTGLQRKMLVLSLAKMLKAV